MRSDDEEEQKADAIERLSLLEISNMVQQMNDDMTPDDCHQMSPMPTTKIIHFYGWVRHLRFCSGGYGDESGSTVYMDLEDGTKISVLKCIIHSKAYTTSSSSNQNNDNDDYSFQRLMFEQLSHLEFLSVGCSVKVEGMIRTNNSESHSNKRHEVELVNISTVWLIGNMDGMRNTRLSTISRSTIRQAEKNLLELRKLQHIPFLRFHSSRVIQCILRIRSKLHWSIHKFMDEGNVICIDPNTIISTSTATTLGDGTTATIPTFQVSTLDISNVADTESNFFTPNVARNDEDRHVRSRCGDKKDNDNDTINRNDNDTTYSLTTMGTSSCILESVVIDGFPKVYSFQKSAFSTEQVITNKDLSEMFIIDYHQQQPQQQQNILPIGPRSHKNKTTTTTKTAHANSLLNGSSFSYTSSSTLLNRILKEAPCTPVDDLMDVVERLIKYCTTYILERCKDEFDWLLLHGGGRGSRRNNDDIQKTASHLLIPITTTTTNNNTTKYAIPPFAMVEEQGHAQQQLQGRRNSWVFVRITYSDAIELIH